MTDLAHIGLTADSRDIVQASAEMDRMAAASKRVEAAVTGMGGAVEASARKVAASIQPADAALEEMAADLARLTNGVHEFATSQKMLQQYSGIWKQMSAQVSDFDTQWTATAGRAAAATQLNTGQMANLSYQINDIAVMLASGQNPFIMLMQQGMQISQVFAPGTGVIGAIKGVGSAIAGFLLNPINLAVIGFAALAGIASMAYSRMSGDSEDAEEAAERLAEDLEALGVKSRGAGDGVDELADKLRNLPADEAREKLRQMEDRIDAIRGKGGFWDRIWPDADKDIADLGQLAERMREVANDNFWDSSKFGPAAAMGGLIDTFRTATADEMPKLKARFEDLAKVPVSSEMDILIKAARELLELLPAIEKGMGQIGNFSPIANDRVAAAFDPIDREAALEDLRSKMQPKREGRKRRGFSDIEAGGEERISQLEAEAAALEMTTGAAEAYRFTQDMIAEATRLGIELSPEQEEALSRLGERYGDAALKAEGFRLELEYREPFEIMRDEIARLDEMLAAGAISWETYAQAKRAALADAHVAMASYAKDALGIMGQLFEDNKAIAIANAIVSTYEGVAKSIAKYPMPFAAVMAGLHLALGMKQVSAIMSTNKNSKSVSGGGGGGGGSGAAAASQQPAAAPPAQAFNLNIYGERVSVSSIEETINKINDHIKDGGTPIITVTRVAA